VVSGESTAANAAAKVQGRADATFCYMSGPQRNRRHPADIPAAPQRSDIRVKAEARASKVKQGQVPWGAKKKV
jgi:hypothetical protein